MTTDGNKASISTLFTDKPLFWGILIAGLVSDIGSKMWAEAAIKPEGWELGTRFPTPTVPFIDGVIAWKWAANIGAAFSIFSGQTVLLASVGCIALLGILWYAHVTPKSDRLMLISLGLVASGAIGNVFDRITRGYVRDFIFFDFELPFHESVSFIPKYYPVYNVADIWILAGAVMLLIAGYRAEKQLAAAKASAE